MPLFPKLDTPQARESYMGIPPLDDPAVQRGWCGPIDVVSGPDTHLNAVRPWLPPGRPDTRRFLIGYELSPHFRVIADQKLQADLVQCPNGCSILYYPTDEDAVASLFEHCWEIALSELAEAADLGTASPRTSSAATIMWQLVIETPPANVWLEGPRSREKRMPLMERIVTLRWVMMRSETPEKFEELCQVWDKENPKKRGVIIAAMDALVGKIGSRIN